LITSKKTKGDTNSSIFFVFSGEVEAKIDEKVLFTYKPGDHFGEIPLLLQKPQPFSFVAKVNLFLDYL